MSELEEEIAAEMGEEGAEAQPDTLEHPDGEPVTPLEQSAEQQASPPRSQKEIDAVQKKLETAAAAYEKKVREAMGEDFALLVPSPVDWIPGFIFNVPEMHPTPEQVQALDALLGRGAAAELREAEDAEGCDKCNALGEVLTGSRKPGQETKPCTACTGTGWRTKAQPIAPVAQFPTQPNVAATGSVPPNQPIAADRWGRPFGHPHYGLEPANVGT